mmetsp:Transcript_27978/g.70796  ORF Transcript_27978/g.70796 Transcript_27978/m.70796 type:complete len:381 (+) Transcript_27978:617-1759(+)
MSSGFFAVPSRRTTCGAWKAAAFSPPSTQGYSIQRLPSNFCVGFSHCFGGTNSTSRLTTSLCRRHIRNRSASGSGANGGSVVSCFPADIVCVAFPRAICFSRKEPSRGCFPACSSFRMRNLPCGMRNRQWTKHGRSCVKETFRISPSAIPGAGSRFPPPTQIAPTRFFVHRLGIGFSVWQKNFTIGSPYDGLVFRSRCSCGTTHSPRHSTITVETTLSIGMGRDVLVRRAVVLVVPLLVRTPSSCGAACILARLRRLLCAAARLWSFAGSKCVADSSSSGVNSTGSASLSLSASPSSASSGSVSTRVLSTSAAAILLPGFDVEEVFTPAFAPASCLLLLEEDVAPPATCSPPPTASEGGSSSVNPSPGSRGAYRPMPRSL